MLGTTLQQRYRIDAVLGRGGMATVYRGFDLRLGRPVAIKCVEASLPGANSIERVISEARAAAALNHPHVVAIYDAGEAAGTPFLVMELIEGPSLRDAGPLTLADVVLIARQMCAALAHAHGHGIVHRDMKPENVLLAPSANGRFAKLADLGVALSLRTLHVTESGALIGTAAYLAPEQALGGAVDGRADLYALGAMLYELTTGRLPFEGDAPLAIVSQHLNAPVVPPRTWRDDLPPSLEAIIVRCLAKRPDDRFESAQALDEALAAVNLTAPAAGPVADGSDRLVLLDRLARGRLIGRQRELSELQALWTRALRGQSHLALLSGEPGVGKTRLAHEITVAAQLAGAVVLRGGCYEFEATTPYLPFVEALQRWVAELDTDTLRQRLGDSAAELSRLAPEIETRLGVTPGPPAAAPHEARLRLFEAVTQLLQDLAADRGVLLVLDDLHWADHSTLALLHHLVRRLRTDRMLVLACYREIELDRTHPLASALVEWNRERLATRVALGRLTRDDTAMLLGAMFGQERSSAAFAEVIHRETEGNPFFVEEVVKSLIEAGQIYREAGEWQRMSIEELAVPQSIRSAIGHRLSKLSEACVDVLHVAAALGKVFPFEELRAATDVGEDALLDALDEASSAQLVRPHERDAFAFTHDKIREVLHEELNPVRQRRLHQRIGERLEQLWGADATSHAADLAYHYARGTDLARGMLYARGAGDHACSVFAFDEAVRFYDAALECAESLGQPERVAAFHELASEALRGAGLDLLSAQRAEQALALATLPADRARLKLSIGDSYAQLSDARAIPYLEQALRELDPVGQRKEVAVATSMMGRMLHYSGDMKGAVERYAAARALLEQDPPSYARGLVLVQTAGAYQHLGLYEESNAWARRAIEEGEQAKDLEIVASGHEFLAENMSVQGQWKECSEHAMRDVTIGQQTHSQGRIAWGHFPWAVASFFMGKTAQGLEHAAACTDLCERIADRRLHSLMLTHASIMRLETGDEAGALEMIERAAQLADEVTHVHMRAEASRARGLYHLRRNEAAIALECFDRCPVLMAGSQSQVNPLLTSMDVAEASLVVGDFERARRHMDAGEALSRAGACSYPAARFRSMRAWIDWLEGRRDHARAEWTATLEQLTALEGHYLRGRVLARWAVLAHAAGERDEAVAIGGRAREVLDACGSLHTRRWMDQALGAA